MHTLLLMSISNRVMKNMQRYREKGGFMKGPTFSSPTIAKEMKRIYGNRAKMIKVQMRHEDAVKNYVMKIEEAHKRAAKSKLIFR